MLQALFFLLRLFIVARWYAGDEHRGPRTMPSRVVRWFVGR